MSNVESTVSVVPGHKLQTILSVENDPGLRTLLKTTLEYGGYTCVEAGDGLEALRVLSQHPTIDLIISDFEMPNMDGLQLHHALKLTPKTKATPFVLSTGNSSLPLRKRALRNGAVAILYKPYTLHELFHMLNRIIFLQSQNSVLSRSTPIKG